MAESENWAFPANLQPKPDEVPFDLKAALDAVVLIRSDVPEDAFTATTLGTERMGNGVVIRDDGLILTIGYLITEAQTLWITTNSGVVVQGHTLAYDQTSGFGLVLPLGRLGVPMLERGSIRSVNVNDEVVVIGQGGRPHALKAKVIEKREFAGYWEYVLDEALFTSPAHPQWGGTAVVNALGKLIGVGSLLIQEKQNGEQVEGNMIVPIDLLEPVFEDMLQLGKPAGLSRPWLGMYTTEAQGHLVVGGLAKGGPAERAGVKVGDVVLEVGSDRPSRLAELFRRIWRMGPAGTEIPFTLARSGTIKNLVVKSADRSDFLKKPRLH
ncbi:MAG: S1C family serine protease [Burkholderiales bacterium]